MIPVKEDRKVISSGVEESIAFGISSKDSIHIMSILRDQLYSDKIMAVLREIGANAADANAMAGRANEPIDVFLPTLADPTLRIRDRGPGLSLGDVRTVFSQYGASTKRDSNEVVGMLGIGSKSPFAYSDSFLVVSWHGGTRATYNAVIDESGAGRIDLLDIEDCGPSETGLEVQMPVKPMDCKAFEERAQALFVHFDPRPRINVPLPDPPATRAVPGARIHEQEDRYSSKWMAVMGRIPYPISLDQLESGTGGADLTRAAKRVSGTLYFDIGELQFAASREALKYGDATRATLIARINRAIDDYVRIVLSDIDSVSGWEKRLRIHALVVRGLPVPPALKPFGDYSVNFQTHNPKGPTGPTLIKGQPFTLQSRNYRERMSVVNSVAVDPSTRLVIKDERRLMSGYRLKATDIVVSYVGDNSPVSTKAVAQFAAEHKIDGIPTVLLSSIGWEKPESSKSPVQRDKAKAQARVLVLDLKGVQGGETGSSVWKAQDHAASGHDVFVVLESYRVPRYETFYEAVREDEAMLRLLGFSMPPVIGHKSTKAKPILAASVLGTEYHRWRVTGMVQLLMTHPDVSRAASAMSFVKDVESHVSWFQGSGPGWIAGELGEGHPLVTFAASDWSSRMVLSAASALVSRAAQFARTSLSKNPFDGDRARAEITERYPLLKAAPDGALRGGNRKLWIDYVKLIDSIDPIDSKQGSQESQEEAAA